jgi:hypothetical protein
LGFVLWVEQRRLLSEPPSFLLPGGLMSTRISVPDVRKFWDAQGGIYAGTVHPRDGMPACQTYKPRVTKFTALVVRRID